MIRRGTLSAAVSVLLVGCTQRPMGYLEGAAGPASLPVQRLGNGFVAIACAVVAIILVLLVVAIARGRRRAREQGALIRDDGRGLAWVYWGIGISTPVLVAMTVWNFVVTREVSAAPASAPVDVEITAHRWWWEMRYRAEPSSDMFMTANELVIPTGVPVRLRLTSADVIHDFWVPKLGPKMDMEPGQWNTTWLQADRAGVYVGQCAEYCGLEHAKMGIRVIALPPPQYAAWQQRMRQPAMASTAPGAALFMASCSGCHTVRGTQAGGIFGPDLTHVGSRTTLAAGMLPNTPAGRLRWISATQQVKPGAQMPQVALGPADLAAIANYLGSLR